MSGYITSLLVLLLASFNCFAQDDDDSTSSQKAVVVAKNQLTIGTDIFQPILNSFSSAKNTYEVSFDYALPKDVYAVLEGGYGNAEVNYTFPDLRYSSTNSFVRFGINKSMLQRQAPTDWDMVFIGLRYAMGFIKRSDAFYTIENQFFGNISGVIPGESLVAHWIEITGGMRVELFRGINAGYNVRAKFLMNPKAIKELAPYSIAGFGRGEKTAVFDFNVYLSYSIRWNKKTAMVTAPAPAQDATTVPQQ